MKKNQQYKLDPEKADQYKQNIDTEKLEELQSKILQLKETTELYRKTTLITFLVNLFLSAADVTLDVKRKPRLTNNSIDTKPWFNAQCRTARSKFHLAKRIHNKFRTQENNTKLL